MSMKNSSRPFIKGIAENSRSLSSPNVLEGIDTQNRPIYNKSYTPMRKTGRYTHLPALVHHAESSVFPPL